MSDYEGDNDITLETTPSKSGIQKRLTSVVWNNFTIIDRKNYIAECNMCNKKLSYRTTVTNLRKHVDRIHSSGYSEAGITHRPRPRIPSTITDNHQQREHRVNRPYEARRSKLTELGGLEGLVLNVIGEDGETDTYVPEDQRDQEEVYVQEVQEYSTADDHQPEKSTSQEHRASKHHQTANVDPIERRNRSRMMDLQLECLEIKKYNMQLEALMLEQQLNVRRSIFTEPLKCPDTYTKGTQTDVGGENTKVFYLTDGKGGMPTRHLFAMQDYD